jgi:hypothetical protein
METSELLDQLSEYQAQVALLDLQKQELLDEVKIPAEVLAAQDEANKQRQKLDSEMWARQKETDRIRNEKLAEIIDPEMPPEFVAALEAARAKRAEIMSESDNKSVGERLKVSEAKAKIDAELQAKVQDVYTQVATRKQEINDEFTEKASGANDNIAKLTAEIKEAVKECKESVKGSYLHAIYVKGRDGGWDTPKLEGYALAHPEILTAKKPDGEPSVTIRKI